MSASDILKGMSSSELDDARVSRNDRLNPPEFSPGQDDCFGDLDDFGSSDGFNDFGTGAGDSLIGGFGDLNSPQQSDSFGGGFGGGFGSLNCTQNTLGQPQESTEDKVFKAMGVGVKGSWNFFKDIAGSFKGLTPKYWSLWGSHTAIVGGITMVGGLILWIVGKDIGFHLAVAGILTVGTGIPVLMFNVDKANQIDSCYKKEVTSSEPEFESELSEEDFGDLDGFEDDEDENLEFDDSELDFEDDMFNDVDEPEPELEPTMNCDDALNSLGDIDGSMVTRQYLFEAVNKVLPSIKPGFASEKCIDEDSDVFIAFADKLREAGIVTGIKEDDLPELLSMKENLMTIKLVISRTSSLRNKEQNIADELAKIYGNDDGIVNEEVYATQVTVGTKCYITIFTGEKALISLKDMYAQCKDFILDTKNYIPVVLGINERGEVITADLKKVDSMLVTGMPRSGKSWCVQAILFQMCTFLSPEELEIHILDPKGGTSDFLNFRLPHVKGFVKDKVKIVEELRKVVNVEGERRRRLMNGLPNIWDFKAKYPDVKMPLLYVVIDEVVTLANEMDKDTKDEFQKLLMIITTQMPNLGIRIFMIPHVVKDDIIKKTTTQVIPCRISVRGDAEHIESSLGIKIKEFPYKLPSVGDMAVKMTTISSKPMYIHGVALSDSNEKNNELFEYMRRVWKKLLPDTVKGSVSEIAEDEQKTDELINSAQSNEDDLEEPVFTDSDKDGISGFNVDEKGIEKNKDKIENKEVTEDGFDDFDLDDFFS